MAGPGEEKAAGAGGRGRLRASHADREAAVSVLKAAFVQGRLAKDEFDQRIGQVLASRTNLELAALTADIPAEVTAVHPHSELVRKSVHGEAVKAWACGVAAFAGVSGIVAVASPGNPGERLERYGLVVLLVPFIAMLLAMLLAFHEWLERRASRQS